MEERRKAIEAQANALLRSGEYEALGEFIEENTDDYEATMTGWAPELEAYVFRQAVIAGIMDYIEERYEYVELNDEGAYSTYLEDAANAQVRDFLLEVGACWPQEHYEDCLFAMDSVTGELIALDDDLLMALREKYLQENGLTEEELERLLTQVSREEWPRDLEDDLRGLCWELEDGKLQEANPWMDDLGWAIRDMLENFGWECSFEGDSWKFETNGVYFIEYADTPEADQEEDPEDSFEEEPEEE